MRGVLGNFRDFLEREGLPFEVREIEPAHIRAWLLSLKQRGLAVSTQEKFYRGLHRFFQWLIEEGAIEASPMQHVKRPPLPRPIVPILSHEHIDRLLGLCPVNTFLGARNRAIILMFYGTGMRLAELSNLRMGNLDLTNHEVLVWRKNNKQQRLYLSPVVCRALISYLKFDRPETDYLWLSEERRPLTREGVKIAIERLKERAGITDIRCSAHTLRHTFATDFLRSGGSLRYLQEILGHSSMRTTERYLTTINQEDGMRAHRIHDPLLRLKEKSSAERWRTFGRQAST